MQVTTLRGGLDFSGGHLVPNGANEKRQPGGQSDLVTVRSNTRGSTLSRASWPPFLTLRVLSTHSMPGRRLSTEEVVGYKQGNLKARKGGLVPCKPPAGSGAHGNPPGAKPIT